jgi:hypothetical protein
MIGLRSGNDQLVLRYIRGQSSKLLSLLLAPESQCPTRAIFEP